MNLDDLDFNEEWELFKAQIGKRMFSFYEVAAFYYEDDDAASNINQRCVTYELDSKTFRIWVELGLAIKINERQYKINPAELCSMSNPRIQHDKEG